MTDVGDAPQGAAAATALPPQVRLTGEGRRGLRATRETMAEMCELRYPGVPERFRFSLTSTSLGTAELVEARVPHVRYERSARHVRAGEDSYLLVIYLRGGCRVGIAGGDIAIAGADIGVIDNACPDRSEVAPPADAADAHHVTLLLPRPRLAPLLAAPDAVGGQLIRGDAGYGRILHGLVLELWRQAAHLDAAQRARVVEAIAGLVAGAIRPAPGREGEIARAESAATRAAILRYLDREVDREIRHPGDAGEAIDVDAVCRRFAMSRASLYRIFEDDGGLVRYVRQQRLQHALQLLMSPAHRHRRIIDIAAQHGFRTESGFIRAFRRRFGVTPGEARAGAITPGDARAGAVTRGGGRGPRSAR